MEHVVHGGQADVLVDAAVTGDEMGVEQFVVVFGVAVAGVCEADRDVTVGDLADRNRLVGDVGKEGTVRCGWRRGDVEMRDAVGCRPAGLPYYDDVVRRVGNAVGADAGDHLREAVRRPGMKLP